VETFESGTTALARFREAPDRFDAVITDLHMPDVSGFDVAEAVRALRPDVRVVLATGYAERVTVEQARGRGIAELLLKPYRRSDLMRVLSARR
jgi:CheY-like chemotaxis protein